MKAVIYARYSSHNQREESIADQERVCRETAKANGDKIVKVYADREKSGLDAIHRTQFQAMVSDAAKHRWSKVYVYKIDRFSRDIYDLAYYRKVLASEGVTVVSAMEPIGSDGPESVLLTALFDGMAAFYSANLSQNIRRGLDGNALRCHHNGVKVFGYDLGPDGVYLVNEAEAAIVREAFERYESGESVGDIAEAFERYPTKRGNRWTVSRLSALLKNEKYVGVYKWKNVRVEDGMPAIVDKGLFNSVQSKMGKRHRRENYYPLVGILFDEDGNRFVGTSGTGKRGKRYHYYWVKGTSRRIPQEKLDAAVYAAVADFISTPDVEDRVVAGMLQAQSEMGGAADAERDRLRERLAEIDRETDRLIDLTVRVGASDRVDERIRALGDEGASILERLDDLDAEYPVVDEKLIRFFLHKISECEAPDSVVRAFVSKVVVGDDHIDVTFGIGEDGGPKDSGTPAETAGNDGCSHRYGLVEQMGANKNTYLAFGPDWFAVIFPR